MSFGYANKDQMKVWKSTAVPDKDYPERATERVMLRVKETDGLQLVHLVATDGYQFVRRAITVDDEVEFKEHTSAIPRQTIEKAEKAMKPSDRAYFEENKVIVKEVIKDERTHEIIDMKTIAVMPYVEQIDMFKEFDVNVLEQAANTPVAKTITLDSRVLKKLVEQLKAGDERVYVDISFRGANDIVTMTAFEAMEDMEIVAAIMPIKS